MKFLSAFLLLIGCRLAVAGELNGSIIFDKTPPIGGVIFVINEKAEPNSTTIDQHSKKFNHHMYVIGQGGEITFTNSDAFEHSIFANDKKTKISFDVGLLQPGQGVTISTNHWGDNSLTKVRCKIHPKMQTYLANIQSDTYQVLEVSDKKNAYEVKLHVNELNRDFGLMIPTFKPLFFTLAIGEKKQFILRRGHRKVTITLQHS